VATTQSNTNDIVDIRNYLYSRSAILWWAAFGIALATQLIALFGVWFDQTAILTIAGSAALIAPVLITWLREEANASFLRADRCRRMLLYADGMGRMPAEHDLAEVRSWTIGRHLAKASFLAPYYSSTKSPGTNRLVEHVAESAFFTHQLSERMGKFVSRIFVVSLLILAATLWMSGIFLPTEKVSDHGFQRFAKSAALMIAFLISGDLLLLWKKYRDLADQTLQIFRQGGSLRTLGDLREHQIMPIIEDYDIALNQGPPIPQRLYKKYVDELNRIYRETYLST
jgi:hypothetical protein